MKRKSKASKKPRRKAARKTAKAARRPRKVAAATAAATAREPGPKSPHAVAEFIVEKGGASMEDLVAKFGIEAHPMRSKIFAARHDLGYAIVLEKRDGDEGKRYYAERPKAA